MDLHTHSYAHLTRVRYHKVAPAVDEVGGFRLSVSNRERMSACEEQGRSISNRYQSSRLSDQPSLYCLSQWRRMEDAVIL